MFKDLAVMVHDQGEIIDNIENNIDNVQVTVVEANKEIVTAKNYQVNI
jgi:syntaxin 12/13